MNAMRVKSSTRVKRSGIVPVRSIASKQNKRSLLRKYLETVYRSRCNFLNFLNLCVSAGDIFHCAIKITKYAAISYRVPSIFSQLSGLHSFSFTSLTSALNLVISSFNSSSKFVIFPNLF